MHTSDWYHINNANEIDSPALLVYPERVKQNIQTAVNMAGSASKLRPHIKTHKSPEVTRMQIEAGINKFKCATIAEAEMLGMCKAKDVLLAYQPTEPKLKRLIELIKKYPETEYSCLVDNIDTAKLISAEALENNLTIPVYIDLNIGMNRTGIKPGPAVLELYLDCNLLTGIMPVGLHAYDGHIHDPDLNVRSAKAKEVYEMVETTKADLVKQGWADPLIIIGGSPTFPFYTDKKDVVISPGTYVYWDAGYLESFIEQDFLPAVLVLARVVSLPDETKVCVDLGHKSVASENILDKRVKFLNAGDYKITSQSEEHMVFEAGKGHPWKPGDVLYGMPYHSCPTVALYERAIVIEDQNVTGEWFNIARDRKISV